MRMAKFLGVIRLKNGHMSEEPLGKYNPGDIVEVIPNDDHKEYPWKDLGSEDDYVAFRTEELEFIIDKELVLDDYL